MAYIVQDSDIERAQPQLVSVSGTATVLSPTRLGRAMRTFFSIIPITAGVTVTVSYSTNPAVANTGIPLIQNQPLTECLTYSNPQDPTLGCWQGDIQVIASGAGQVAFVEKFDV